MPGKELKLKPLTLKEEDIQGVFIQYAKMYLRGDADLVFSIPNEAKRSFSVVAHMKKLGLTKGVPDVMVAIPKGGYHGLFIEFKSAKGRVRPEQAAFHEKLRAQGYCVEVCRDSLEAIKLFQDYLQNRENKV